MPDYLLLCEIAQNASECGPDIILEKFFNPHHRSVILSAEPLAALPTLTPSSSVATRHSASKLASALAAPSVRSADVAAIATGVSQARPRLRLGRGVSKLPLCTRLARGFAPCAVVLARPKLAVAVQDFQPCPAVKAIGFDFGCGEALRKQGENVPKLLVR